MKKTTWIAWTAICLALLVCLQFLTRSLSQLVTGSCVNLILAMTALTGGVWSGVTVAALSPVFAKLLGIGPVWALVPCVAVGNAVYAVLFALLVEKALHRDTPTAAYGCMLLAALAKFLTLWLLIVKLVAPLVIPKAEVLAKITAMFTWPQLFTAMVGGALACLVAPIVQKALNGRKS